MTNVDFLFDGLPPKKPEAPKGNIFVLDGRTYTFLSSTTDPDGHQLYYKFKWGDGTYSGWLGPYESGETVTASHKWNKTRRYLSSVVAKDTLGTLSKWSNYTRIFVITPPKGTQQATNNRCNSQIDNMVAGDTHSSQQNSQVEISINSML